MAAGICGDVKFAGAEGALRTNGEQSPPQVEALNLLPVTTPTAFSWPTTLEPHGPSTSRGTIEGAIALAARLPRTVAQITRPFLQGKNRWGT